ncbi:MAG: two-component regulator propeller domain-containing protein [Ignavibacteriaceae bacterium]|nr:two-component regulator propeller domain-containing protein [Ignavibacteriaceae bacterium]
MQQLSKIIHLYIGIFLLLFHESGFAQPKILSDIRFIPSSGKYLTSQWTSNQGLPQNTINQIAQDSKGFIWAATFGGLVRFDGINFKVYSVKEYQGLISDRIRNIFIDSKDHIWISTESHKLIIFDGKNFIDKSHLFPNSTLQIIPMIETSGGGVYLSIDSLIYFEKDGNLTLVKTKINKINQLPLWNITSSPILNNDTLFVIKDNLLALVYEGKVIKSLYANLEPAYSNSCVYNKYGYWFIQGRKLYYSKTFEGLLNPKRVFPERTFIAIYGKGNDIIAGTHDNDIVLIRDKNLSVIQSNNNKLVTIYTSYFIDRERNYWIGTELNGLYYIKKRFLYTLDQSYGINTLNTYPILKASDGSIWIGQNIGLQRIDKGKVYSYKPDDNNSITTWGLAEDREKNIWIASNGNGIWKYDGKNFEKIKNKSNRYLNINNLSAFCDKDNRIWIGRKGSIVRFSNGKEEYFDPNNNINNLYLNFIQDDAGIIWVASNDGVFKFENGKFVLDNSLSLKYSRSLYLDSKKRLWTGSYGNGIIIKSNKKYFSLTEKEGLYNNIISAIVEDGKGNYWFSTNKGIFKIQSAQIDNFINGKAEKVISIKYGEDEGLVNTEFNGGCQPSSMKDDEGNLWFPSFGGAVIIDVKALTNSTTQPEVIIESLVTKDSIYYPNEKILLPASYSNFTITYKSPSFSSPQNVKFMYRLKGLENEWHENGNKREITFQKLPYGDYEFEVIVTDGYGNSSKKAGIIQFSVDSIFYETPFFYLIVSLSIIILISSLYFIRIRIARKDALKLESLVNERTISLQKAKEDAERLAGEEKILRAQAEEENRQKIELLRIVSHDLKNPVFAI